MSEHDSVSRRSLLRGGLLRRGVAAVTGEITGESKGTTGAAPTSADEPRGAHAASRATLPVHRPPGAVDERSFLGGCTRCGDCIRACPADAIVLAPPRFREAAGTPMIDPSVAPCIMCADTPCISACKPAVLRRDQPLTMARASILKHACLAWNGSFCSVCSERCPVQGAIAIDAGRPRILEERCTGCGVCAFVCPAPGSAIMVMPLQDRPAVRPSGAEP